MREWEWQLLEDKVPEALVTAAGLGLKRGDRVVLRPRSGGDIFDLALAGQVAQIEAVEQDYEGKVHLAVVIEDDPGKDLGALRQPGHRFFFTPEEVEPYTPTDADSRLAQPRILIAGIGNIFLGDDGFGVEAAQRLAAEEFPPSVCVRDFGIRGYDLTYALLERYELVILIDACPRGQTPGTVYVIEPELDEAVECAESVAVDGHTMNPMNVLRLAKAMGPIASRIVLVGCEPATLGGEEGHIGLSEPVGAALGQTVKLVKRIVQATLSGEELAASYGV